MVMFDVDVTLKKKIFEVGGEDHGGKKLRTHPRYTTIYLYHPGRSYTLEGRIDDVDSVDGD